MIQHINLLLFSARALAFGVYAEQVEELLDARMFPEPKDLSSESLIPYKGQDIRVIHFSRRLGLEKQKVSAPGSSPKILIIKCRNSGYIGVRVEHLKKLLTISINQVHSLPVIMQKKRRLEAIWGIALIEEQPVILIDLGQL